MKKFISAILSFAIVANTCSTVSFADVPYDYTNPKCIDIRKLGNETDFISKDGKICGRKKCTLDAVTFNKLEDYVDELKTRFKILKTLDITKTETNIKLKNLEIILESLLKEIYTRSYKNKNFFIAATSYGRFSAGAIAQFAQKDGITYDENIFNEDFFNKLNREKVYPLLENVRVYVQKSTSEINLATEAWWLWGILAVPTAMQVIPMAIDEYKKGNIWESVELVVKGSFLMFLFKLSFQ